MDHPSLLQIWPLICNYPSNLKKHTHWNTKNEMRVFLKRVKHNQQKIPGYLSAFGYDCIESLTKILFILLAISKDIDERCFTSTVLIHHLLCSCFLTWWENKEIGSLCKWRVHYPRQTHVKRKITPLPILPGEPAAYITSKCSSKRSKMYIHIFQFLRPSASSAKTVLRQKVLQFIILRQKKGLNLAFCDKKGP